MRNRQVGPPGIDVHRRHIDFNLGRNFLKIKLADTARAKTQSSFEFHWNPVGVFANSEREALRIQRDLRLRLARIGTNFKLGAQFPALPVSQRIVWAADIAPQYLAVAFNRNADSTFAKFVPLAASGAETKRPLATFQIRNAHSGKKHAGEFLRRKSDWHANYR